MSEVSGSYQKKKKKSHTKDCCSGRRVLVPQPQSLQQAEQAPLVWAEHNFLIEGQKHSCKLKFWGQVLVPGFTGILFYLGSEEGRHAGARLWHSAMKLGAKKPRSWMRDLPPNSPAGSQTQALGFVSTLM